MSLTKKENEGFAKALALAALVLPFIFTTGPQGVRYAQMLAFILIGSIFWAIHLAKNISWSLGFIYFVAAASAVFSGFGEIHAVSLVFVTSGTLIIYFSKDISLASSKSFLYLLTIAGALQALYGYCQVFGFDPIFERLQTNDNWIPVGTIGQQTLYGPFLVASMSAALVINPLLALIILPAILLTMSVTTYLSLFAVLFVHGLSKYGFKAAVSALSLMLVAGIASLFFTDNLNFFDPHGRFIVWKKALDLWKKKALFGWGLGSYKVIAPLNVPEGITKANGFFLQCHNDYIQVLFELGIVGLLGIIWLIVDFCKSAYALRNNKEVVALAGIFLAIAVNALANFPIHVAPLAFLALISWSLVVCNKSKAT